MLAALGTFAKMSIFAIPCKKGAVAQSVEQRTENPCVGGSIPPHTTLLILKH
jgi:hypothetical protein